MKKLARILWRIMPESLRRAMAIEAPVVLRPVTKFMTRPMWDRLDDGRSQFRIRFTDIEKWEESPSTDLPVFGTGLDDTERMSRDEAFNALTESLRKRKDVVLVEDER